MTLAKKGEPIVHPTAVIEDGAVLGKNCRIGPFCVVGPEVYLGDSVRLISHVVVLGKTVIGDETVIWPFSSIGSDPQDLKFKGEKTELAIGKRNKIREGVSINPGTKGGGGITRIGDDCLLMLGSHIGHDCQIGNSIVMANNSAVAGHVTIEDNVTIGGLSGIHQFCRIGQGAMIGAVSMVNNDVIPYAAVVGERANLTGLNIIGLKRRGVPQEVINSVRKTFFNLFDPDKNFKDQARVLASSEPENECINIVLDFILSDTNRSFVTPKNKTRY
jgi:UDP-N-acetylglucosamine acyltransferase